MSKADKHALTQLSPLAEFDGMAARWRDTGPPPGWTDWDAHEAQIAVPAGPNAHW